MSHHVSHIERNGIDGSLLCLLESFLKDKLQGVEKYKEGCTKKIGFRSVFVPYLYQ